jgi:hypothetical protein
MGTRHHVTGRFAAKGRPPRTEIKSGAKSAVKPSKNAAYNNLVTTATKAAARATPGQLVGSGIKLS